MKKISVEEIARRLQDVHGDVVTIVRDSYTGVAEKARFIDRDFGEWTAYVHNVCRGHSHPARGKKKSSETCIHRYGASSPLGSHQIRKRVEDALMSSHGVKNVMQLDDVREKARQTLQERYGVDNPQQSKEIRDRAAATCQERYGSSSPFGSEAVRARGKETLLERYGVENPMQADVVRQRVEKTCHERYGVKNPAQSAEVHSKSSSSMKRSREFIHWKTGEKLTAVGSYEAATIEWFNRNGIDYDWQVPLQINTGELAGRTYIVDARVKSAFGVDVNYYVEIKGHWMQDVSKKKWEWLNQEHPDCSFLWTKDILETLGVL